MTKFKKAVICMLCVLVACFMALSFVGCDDPGDDEDKKYDVAIRIGCSDGTIYEFPVGEDEKHVTIPYDGEERTFWVESYNLPDHPRYGDEWFAPSGEGANVFELHIAKENIGEVRSICDEGLYCINIYADITSTLWNTRTALLFITVE